MNSIHGRAGIAWGFLLAAIWLAGCSSVRLPAIDPTGNRIFLPAPNSTSLLTPGKLGHHHRRNPNPFGPANASFQASPLPPTPAAPIVSGPVGPAYQNPAPPESCCTGDGTGCQFRTRNHKHVIPKPGGFKTAGNRGEIIMSPYRIIAPVGSEVVVLTGICGDGGHYLLNQPIEWNLSNDSVGQFIEVGGTQHSTFNQLVPPTSKKISGSYAKGRTGLKELLLSRGTPTPIDDIQLAKGQTYVSVSSESPGTSYVTGIAPEAEAWDKRRTSTIIHWVDGVWAIPVPTVATAATVHPLTTVISRSSTGTGVAGWKVRYAIAGGAPAEFAPTGSQTAEATSDSEGRATVQIRQVAGKYEPGTTQVRVEVIRPALYGEPELVVESGITSVTWSAPAITIRAIGPRTAGVGEAFNYRIEVTNPGDQVARGVVVRTRNFDENLEYISSTPKPTEYGREFAWQLGDIVPNSPAKIIDVQVKSPARGNVSVNFEVASQSDGLKTEALAQTEIRLPCIGLDVTGPARARVGEEVDYEIVIVNQCEEPLRNLRLVLQYDSGISVRGMGNPISLTIDELGFGERRAIPIQMIVNQPGVRCFELSVTADGGDTATAKECFDAIQATDAAVALQVQSQGVTDVGNLVSVEATVINNGNVILNDLTLTNRFTNSLTPKFVSEGFDAVQLAEDELGFTIRQLRPGQQVSIRIDFEGVRVDGNARSEFTITNRTGDVAETRGADIRVMPAGEGGGLPPIPPAGDPNREMNIPDGPGGGAAAGELQLDVRALTPDVELNGVVSFEVTVTNARASNDQNIAVQFLVPPGLTMVDFREQSNTLRIAEQSPDNRQFRVQQRLEMRPGEQLRLLIDCRADQVGQATLEVEAVSAQSSFPKTGRATVTINQ